MGIKKCIIKAALLLCVGMVFTQVFAEPAWLRGATDKMLSDLATAKNNGTLNSSSVYRMVQRDIVPYVDMDTVSMRVVGPACWNSANASTKSQFKNEFTKFVIRTYEAPLENYNNDKIEFVGDSGGYVNSYIIRTNGQKTSLNYELKGSKIVDLVVENVSMVNSYKAQFDCNNLSQLVGELKQHNANQ